jgi:signal peptidase I
VSNESRLPWEIVDEGEAGWAEARDAGSRWDTGSEPTMDSAHSYAPPAPPKRPTAVRRGTSEFARTVLLAALVFVGARMFVLPYEVEGKSMFPNLHSSERVLVNRSVYYHFDLNRVLNMVPGVDVSGERVIYPFHSPERGDIVVLNPPVEHASQPYIKRVIGLPGETITFRDGYVYIDGKRLDEPYIAGAITDCDVGDGCKSGKVPEGHVFVLGDNRGKSADSRSFGFVKIDDIIGKAWFANWPLDSIGFLPHYDYEG